MITDRIDAITQLPEDRRQARLPAPRSVKIELTARCNFQCGFCANRMRVKEQTDMDRATFERLALEMRAAGVEELGMFYVGESMLCQWLPEAIAFAKNVAGFPYVFLTTNGSLATPERAEACMAAGLDSLKWSFNNADGEQLEKVAGVAPKFYARVVENIKTAHAIREAKGYKTKLYASSILFDGEQGKRMEASVAEILPFVDQHYWLPLYSFGSLAAAQEKELGYRPTAGNQGRIGALREPLPCWSAFTEGHVTAEGKLSACCFDTDDQWEMGDLNKVSFMDAWNSPAFLALREAHLRKDVSGTACEKCVAYK